MAGEKKTAKKSNNGLIAIIIAAVVVVAGATLLLLWLFVWNSSGPANMEELRIALKDKKAVNCVVSVPETGDVVIQTNDGFTKVKMSGEFQEGQGKMNMLVTDGITYIWTEGGLLAFKTKSTQVIDGMMEGIKSEDADAIAKTKDNKVKCEAASKADFSVPSYNFIDTDSMNMGQDDEDDFDWGDWE